MKKAIYIYVTLCLLTILTGCGSGQMPRELQAVNSIINQHPDSALVMLDSMEAEKAHWDKDAQMRYDLLRLKAQNKLYIDFPNDSLPRVLVDYFDSHGTRNDRVLARYMLGRAYHAMGDAPMALETYYDAISLADTLSPDCDLDALRGVYGQMSQIFHQQNLPHDELRALEQHIRITQLICSEEEAIIAKGQLIKPYFLMDSLDLYLQNINDCYRDFMRMGNRKMAAETVGPAVPIYVWRGQLDKARELTDIYERESGLFDEQGNIAAGRESYYYCKGLFLLAVHETDSAEYYYRKAIRYGYLPEGYKGLLQVYRERHNADSMAHYSLLFEQAQDSLHNKMRTEAIHQMSALYDYSRSQKQAEQEATKAREARMWLWSICLIALFVIVIGIYVYRHRQRQNRERIQHLRMIQRDIQRSSNETIAENKQKIAQLEQQMTALQGQHSQMEAQLETYRQRLLTQNAIALAEQGERRQSALVLKQTEAYRMVTSHVQAGTIISDDEWQAIDKAVDDVYPNFRERLDMLCCLSQQEYRICLLQKMGIEPSRMANLTAHTKSSVTQTRKRLYKKCFGQDGTAEQWDAFVASL